LADLDGNQVLEFYWTDAIDAMTRAVAKDNIYTTFQTGKSVLEILELG
jgi:hypothetical protein